MDGGEFGMIVAICGGVALSIGSTNAELGMGQGDVDVDVVAQSDDAATKSCF